MINVKIYESNFFMAYAEMTTADFHRQAKVKFCNLVCKNFTPGNPWFWEDEATSTMNRLVEVRRA